MSVAPTSETPQPSPRRKQWPWPSNSVPSAAAIVLWLMFSGSWMVDPGIPLWLELLLGTVATIEVSALWMVLWRSTRRRSVRRPALAPQLALHSGGAIFFGLAWQVPLQWIGPSYGFASWVFGLLCGIVIYGMSLTSCWALRNYRAAAATATYAARAEEAANSAQLRALNAWFSPHLLFNALHSIRFLCTSRPEEGQRGLATLADLLSFSLHHGTGSDVTLGEEVRLMRRYIDLQKMRFAKRLEVEVSIAPEALSAIVPPFSLQTLVENAVRHGLSSEIPHLEVCVRGALADGMLHLSVADNGLGAEALQLRPDGSLNRLRTRLEQRGGGGLTVVNRPHRGFEVALALPHRVPAKSALHGPPSPNVGTNDHDEARPQSPRLLHPSSVRRALLATAASTTAVLAAARVARGDHLVEAGIYAGALVAWTAALARFVWRHSARWISWTPDLPSVLHEALLAAAFAVTWRLPFQLLVLWQGKSSTYLVEYGVGLFLYALIGFSSFAWRTDLRRREMMRQAAAYEASRSALELAERTHRMQTEFLDRATRGVSALHDHDRQRGLLALDGLAKVSRFLVSSQNRKWVPLAREIEFCRAKWDLRRQIGDVVADLEGFECAAPPERCLVPPGFISQILECCESSTCGNAPGRYRLTIETSPDLHELPELPELTVHLSRPLSSSELTRTMETLDPRIGERWQSCEPAEHPVRSIRASPPRPTTSRSAAGHHGAVASAQDPAT